MDSVSTSDNIFVKTKSTLSFKQMFNREDLSDITLQCGRNKFRVHRFLLAACSPYLRSLFQTKKSSTITLDNVNVDDLRLVLHYMYHGSVKIKNDEIQGFCELLELFLMSIPDDIAVSVSESESQDEVEMKSEPDTEYKIEGKFWTKNQKIFYPKTKRYQLKMIQILALVSDDRYEKFIRGVRDILETLSKENVQNNATHLLNLTALEEFKLDTVIDLILQLVLQPNSSVGNLLVSLVKHICVQNDTKLLRQDTAYFQYALRKSAIELFVDECRSVPMQRPPEPISLNEIDMNFNSLDKQAKLVGTIDCHCTTVRFQRLAHFIGHLLRINLISVKDIDDLIKRQLPYESDLRGEKHTQENCCNFELPQTVDNIFKGEWYQYVSPTANDIFWARSKVNN